MVAWMQRGFVGLWRGSQVGLATPVVHIGYRTDICRLGMDVTSLAPTVPPWTSHGHHFAALRISPAHRGLTW